MYGTVARLRIKPGMDAAMERYAHEIESVSVAGQRAVYLYRMEAEPNVAYLAVVFADKASYRANAESPEQHQRYLQMLELLVAEPEWHDGEIVYANVTSG